MTPQERAQHLKRQDVYRSTSEKLKTAMYVSQLQMQGQPHAYGALLSFVRVANQLTRLFEQHGYHADALHLSLWLCRKLDEAVAINEADERWFYFCAKYILQTQAKAQRISSHFDNLSPLLRPLPRFKHSKARSHGKTSSRR